MRNMIRNIPTNLVGFAMFGLVFIGGPIALIMIFVGLNSLTEDMAASPKVTPQVQISQGGDQTVQATQAPTAVPAVTKYEDAGNLPTSEYTATVYTGRNLYASPDDGASRTRTPGELVVKIVGFDYTSHGWSLVELDGGMRVWVHSFDMDLPDGSIVLHQLPELVR